MKGMWTVLILLGMADLPPIEESVEVIPGTNTPVEALARNLEWDFLVTADPPAELSSGCREEGWRFRSKEPYSQTTEGKLFLRFTFRVFRCEGDGQAEALLDAWREKSRGQIPWTYLWGRILLHEGILYRLDLPCTFSEANVEKVAATLMEALAAEAGQGMPGLHCVCGGRCVEGSYSSSGVFAPGSSTLGDGNVPPQR